MKIYKFGGASIKDANAIENLFKILQKRGYEKTLVVVSAIGKTTNALELVVRNYFQTTFGFLIHLLKQISMG